MRDAEDRSLIGEIVIILYLVDRRQQQQSDERGCHQGKEWKHAADISGLSSIISIRPTKTSAIVPRTGGRQRCTNAIGEIRRIIGRLRNVIDQNWNAAAALQTVMSYPPRPEW